MARILGPPSNQVSCTPTASAMWFATASGRLMHWTDFDEEPAHVMQEVQSGAYSRGLRADRSEGILFRLETSSVLARRSTTLEEEDWTDLIDFGANNFTEGIEIDTVHQEVFVSDDDGQITRVDYDGNVIDTVLSSPESTRVTGLAYEPVNDRIYYHADTSSLKWVARTGGTPTVVSANGQPVAHGPFQGVLDLDSGFYFCGYRGINQNLGILRITLADGSSEYIVPADSNDPIQNSVACAIVGGQLYFGQAKPLETRALIRRVNYDGSDLETIHETGTGASYIAGMVIF